MAKKLFWTRESLANEILGQIFYFTPHFTDFGAYMCILEVKECIFKILIRI